MSARLCTAYFSLTSMLLPAAGNAATLVVDPTGQGDFTHIQPALDAAAEGDTVLVAPGEYVTADTLRFRASRTTLRSEGGHAVTTIRLAPPAGDTTLRFVVNIGNGVLDGFTVTGGTRGAITGGGGESQPPAMIVRSLITGNTRERDPTWGEDRYGIVMTGDGLELADCIITQNTGLVILGEWPFGEVTAVGCRILNNAGPVAIAPYEGDVDACEGPRLRFEDCDILDNAGGLWGCNVYLLRCRFAGNNGGVGDWNVHVRDSVVIDNGDRVHGHDLQVQGSVVARNHGVGGLECQQGTLLVAHSTVADNDGSAIHVTSINGGGGRSLTVESSILWGNNSLWSNAVPEGGSGPEFRTVAITSSDLQEPHAGIGNVTLDPLFCPSANGGPSYALSSLSPCLGTGSGGSNMGAPTGTCAGLIVDNGDPGTLEQGTWYNSGGANPHGTSSRYANTPDADYTFALLVPAAGEYELSLWWTTWPSRLAAVPVEIRHAGGTATLSINQQLNAGRWNVLGKWRFDGVGSVRIVSLGGGSTCADAVRLVPVGAPADLVLDNGQPGTSSTGSWAPSSGTEPYGGGSLYSKQPGASYRYALSVPAAGAYTAWMWWSGFPSRPSSARVQVEHAGGMSSVQVNQQVNAGQWNELGDWNFEASAVITIFAASAGSTCADAVRLTAGGAAPPYEEVVDNGEPGTAAVGYWPVSGGPNPYGPSSLYSKQPGATYSYSFELPAPAEYEVYLWWTAFPSRPSSVRVVLMSGGSTPRTLYVNQAANASVWNSLGKHVLAGRATVTIHSAGAGSTCADAARIVRRGGAELPPLPAPFAHWSFDEGSGTTAHDGAGDRDASIVGATWTAGRVGQALRFDGVDDYVVVPGVLRFEALSFAAWVQSSTSYLNNRRIITLHDGIDPSYYHFDLEANTRGGPQVYAGSGTVNNYDWTLSPGVWTHLTVTHDGAAGRIYWNGQLIEEGPLAVGYHEGTIFIGGVETPNGAALAWSGLIDEVVVFDRALTAAEVWRLYVDGVR